MHSRCLIHYWVLCRMRGIVCGLLARTAGGGPREVGVSRLCPPGTSPPCSGLVWAGECRVADSPPRVIGPSGRVHVPQNSALRQWALAQPEMAPSPAQGQRTDLLPAVATSMHLPHSELNCGCARARRPAFAGALLLPGPCHNRPCPPPHHPLCSASASPARLSRTPPWR